MKALALDSFNFNGLLFVKFAIIHKIIIQIILVLVCPMRRSLYVISSALQRLSNCTSHTFCTKVFLDAARSVSSLAASSLGFSRTPRSMSSEKGAATFWTSIEGSLTET